MSESSWNAIILAASRGPADPMAKAFGVANKCAIPVAGMPMLARVAGALKDSGIVHSSLISIENPEIAKSILGNAVRIIEPAGSAPASVIEALSQQNLEYPVLITTGDHPLLTPAMIHHFCRAAENSGADVAVALATAETILAAYPQSLRTFFRFGSERVSGCNLFALRSAAALKLLSRWQDFEQVRKKPWRLVADFGLLPLLRLLTGTLTLAQAFAIVSAKTGALVRPVIMPFAEAAIDVDKPADKLLAEEILAKRT